MGVGMPSDVKVTEAGSDLPIRYRLYNQNPFQIQTGATASSCGHAKACAISSMVNASDRCARAIASFRLE
jgi:hypothetical protein